MSLINVDTIESRVGGPPTLSKGVLVSAAETFSGDLTRFDGAVSIGGTLTYEDVTNVDAIGIVTARGGMQFGAAGVGGTVTSVGNATFAGIVTATTFTGAVTGTASGNPVLTGSTNNTIVTVTGSNAIAGEANLTFNGTGDLTLTGNEGVSANLYLIADEGDDNGDGWRVGSNQDTNDLTIANNSSGSYVDKITLLTDKCTVGTNVAVTGVSTFSGNVKVVGVTSTTSFTVGPGVIQENLFTEASAATGAGNYDILTRGAVQYYTANSAGTWTTNLRGDGSTTFNSLMHIGQTTVLTFYYAQNNASYYMTDFLIDGSSQTEKWNGGSAPSAGGSSGVDVYTFNVMKTGDATFTVFANYANFA